MPAGPGPPNCFTTHSASNKSRRAVLNCHYIDCDLGTIWWVKACLLSRHGYHISSVCSISYHSMQAHPFPPWPGAAQTSDSHMPLSLSAAIGACLAPPSAHSNTEHGLWLPYDVRFMWMSSFVIGTVCLR